MANFDVLSGRLLLDTGEFVRGLQQASTAAQLFTQRLGVSLQSARRDVDQLSASQLKLVDSARLLSGAAARSPWSAAFTGPAAAFNNPTGTTSQAALMGFVLRVNQSLSRQANLADQLTEAVDRVRIAVEERARPGQEVHDKFKMAADMVVGLLKKAVDAIEAPLEKLIDKAAEAAHKVGELNDDLNELGDKGGEAAKNVDKLNPKIKDLGEKSEDAAGKLEKLGDRLKETVAGLTSTPGAAGMGGGGMAGGAMGMGPLGLGNGPAAMAGGFAPPGQRGQAPAPGPVLNAVDPLADRVIGAIRARNAAGPQLRSPEADKIRAEVAARDIQKHEKNAGAIDDLAKMLGQAGSLRDAVALFGRLGRAVVGGITDAARSYARQGADNQTTRNLAPKQLQPVRQELSAFHQRHQQDLKDLTKRFSANPPADRETAAARQQALAQLREQAQFIKSLIRDIATKGGEAREVATQQYLKARRLYQDDVDALAKLDPGLHEFAETIKVANKQAKELGNAAKKAAGDVDKLDEAEQAKAAHAKGQLTQQEQQMQQAAQQFQQQVGQWFQNQVQKAAQQLGQQAWDSGQVMLEQALGGPGQVQEMIDQAAASGDMKTAIALIRQRLEAQLSQSKINLHNLASDPMAGGGFGSAHGGASNDAYFMTLDIPLVRLIKFLQAQLDHLPKMAAGGIVSGATAAIVGEAGPEAVLPLTNFGNMLGALPVFQGIQTAMEKIGDYFDGIGDVGMAKRYFANLDKIQSVFDYATDRLDNARRLDFMPASIRGGLRPGGGAAGAIGIGGRMAYATGAAAVHFSGPLNLHFHGVDITKPGAASAFAQQLLPALDAEARRAGVDMMGPSMLRSGGAVTANRAYGYSR